MIAIIRRELADRLTSTQFIILFAVSTLLFFAAGYVAGKNHDAESVWYTRKMTETYRHPSTMSTQLYAPPNQLSFITEAGERSLPSGYRLSPKGVLTPFPSRAGRNWLAELPSLDWSFIVKVIFSLYAILFAYDRIAGEKEIGTLRLVCSHSIGRTRLLMAKYTATMLTLSLPLVFGILVSLTVICVFIPGVLSGVNLSAVLLAASLALLYTSLFVLLSLYFSSLFHQSSMALLSLLAAWIILAVIVPSTAGVVSDTMAKVPGEYQTAKQLGPMIQQQVWGRIEKIRQMASNGEIRTREEAVREADHAYDEGQQGLIMYYEAYDNAVRERARLARSLSRFSPTALFQYASEAIAGAGAGREERFLNEVHEYSKTYDAYILRKVGALVAHSNWSFVTYIDVRGESVRLESPRPKEYPGDKSDFPRFAELPRPVSEGVQEALEDSAGLILWNVVLSVLAFSAIIRSDVR